MHRLTEIVLERPRLALSLLLAITLFLGSGLLRLDTMYGYRVLIGENHPAVQNMDAVIEQYAGGLPVRVAWECGPDQPCSNAFDETSLRMAHSITRDLQVGDGIAEVLGPTNAPLLVPTQEGFDVRRLVEYEDIVGDVSALRQQALSDSSWVGNYVSEDGRVGVIIVQASDTRNDTTLQVLEQIERVIEPYRAQGFQFNLIGEAIASIGSTSSLGASMERLVPVIGLMIAVVLYFLSRSWRSVALALGMVMVSLVWTFGLMGWVGWPRDTAVLFLPAMVLIIGVCDSIHLLDRFRIISINQPGHTEGKQAMIEASRDVGTACTLTTLTTAGAFLSFAASGLDTYMRFGPEAAFACIACLILTFTLLPLFGRHIGAPAQIGHHSQLSRSWKVVLDSIVSVTQKRSRSILICASLVIAFGGYQSATNLRIDTDWVQALGTNSIQSQASNFFEEKLRPWATLELDIRLPQGLTAADPEVIKIIDKMAERISATEGLGKTESLLDPISRLNQYLHDDNPAFYQMGATKSENMQLIEMINISSPIGISMWASPDLNRIRMSSDSLMRTHSVWVAILNEVNRIVEETVPENWEVIPTGALPVRVAWAEAIQHTQLRSFPIAFGIVFLMVVAFLRSWTLGLFAMVPLLVPVVFILGLMGASDMSLDVARAMIAAIVIGIGVDDAIHFLSHYSRRRQTGDAPHPAMRAALYHTGRAVVTTSVALALGFMTLMLSSWQTISSFGFLIAVAIMGALISTLLVLPSMIFAFTPNSPDRSEVASAISPPTMPALQNQEEFRVRAK